MFCKYCGKRLSDRAIFCSACGKRLVSCEESYEDFYNDAVESVQNQKNLKYCK
ncbi:MAG: zinc ribbon domain-containing protein, partial [Treponema sp.]|nr:zinc ribbon domain-containing protein [Treponema sp.]